MSQTFDPALLSEPINSREKLLKLAEISPSKVKKKSPKHQNLNKWSPVKDSKCDLSFSENIEHLVNKDTIQQSPELNSIHYDNQKYSKNHNVNKNLTLALPCVVQTETSDSNESINISDLRIGDLKICESTKNVLKSRIPQPIYKPFYDHRHEFINSSSISKQRQSNIPVYNLHNNHLKKTNSFNLRHLVTSNDFHNDDCLYQMDVHGSYIPVYKSLSSHSKPLTVCNELTNQYYSQSSHTNHSSTNTAFCSCNNRKHSHLDMEFSPLSPDKDNSYFNYHRYNSNSSTKSKVTKSRSYNVFNRNGSKDVFHRYQTRTRQADHADQTNLDILSQTEKVSNNSSQNFKKMLTRLDTFYVLDEESFTDSPKKIINTGFFSNNLEHRDSDCSPNEYKLADRSFLKECQKNTLFQINDMRECANEHLDQVFKSSSCDNLEEMIFPTLNKPKSETDLMLNKNDLSGISHLKKDESESMFNKFRKSFSLHFTKNHSLPLENKSFFANVDNKCNEIDINQNICLFENCKTDHFNGKLSTIERRKSKLELFNRRSLRKNSKKNVCMKRVHSQQCRDGTIDDDNEHRIKLLDQQSPTKFECAQSNLRNLLENNSSMSDDVIYAEAIWDHFSNDSEELSFHAGDLIDVTDTSHKQWWWGAIKKDGETKYGWFPASYVRLKVSQEETLEEALANPQENVESTPKKRMSLSKISSEQVRANVVLEIINTERDFVKNLKDVIEGYLKPCRDRKDMFDETRITTIFGNIEELYEFQSKFLTEIEQCVMWENLSQSQIGQCFLNNEKEFGVYAEFCKNHHLAISELQDLYTDHKYVVFFEGCRLLQNMIDISLDGFLLTPIQKICKYPLQLGELLKYTRNDHEDYDHISNAYKCMQRVAQLVNERKRRFENLEQLITFQESFENWTGPLLLDTCSLLIHSGDITRITRSSWSKDVMLLLFDHVLIMCKRDTRILKKGNYIFKNRIELDHVGEILSMDDNSKDVHFNVVTKNAFKFFYSIKQKWYMFQAKTASDRDKWVNSFMEERRRVKEDYEQGFYVSEQDKKGARIAHQNKLKPKKPKTRRPYPIVKKPDTVIAEIPLGPVNGFEIDRNRAGSLPSYIFQEKQAINLYKNRQSTLHKKARSNWFQLGSNKKNRLKRTFK